MGKSKAADGSVRPTRANGGRGVSAGEGRFLHAPSLALRLSRNDTVVRWASRPQSPAGRGGEAAREIPSTNVSGQALWPAMKSAGSQDDKWRESGKSSA